MAIEILKPVKAGDTIVEGRGEPNQAITLHVLQTGLNVPGTINASGNFVFDGLPPLVGGHTVIVEGYGSQDLALVEAGTPTPTPTLTPTPAPAGPYITLNPTCTDDNVQEIVVTGHNWPTDGSVSSIEFFWDGDYQTKLNYKDEGTFTVSFVVSVSDGEHTVEAQGLLKKVLKVSAQAPFSKPCATTPTPTPTPSTKPDLVVTGLSLQNDGPVGTYETLEVGVTVANQGLGDATSLSWVELHADPADVTNLAGQAGVDAVAVGSLAAGGTMSFTMYVPGGFETTGAHTLVAMVDAWEQVLETEESNNVSASLGVTLTLDNPAPTPTPTPDPDLQVGSLSGLTFINGIIQENVYVTVYDAAGNEVAKVRSNLDGWYSVPNLPTGMYTVVGETRVGLDLYRGQMGPVEVWADFDTGGVDLNLRMVVSR